MAADRALALALEANTKREGKNNLSSTSSSSTTPPPQTNLKENNSNLVSDNLEPKTAEKQNPAIAGVASNTINQSASEKPTALTRSIYKLSDNEVEYVQNPKIKYHNIQNKDLFASVLYNTCSHYISSSHLVWGEYDNMAKYLRDLVNDLGTTKSSRYISNKEVRAVAYCSILFSLINYLREKKSKNFLPLLMDNFYNATISHNNQTDFFFSENFITQFEKKYDVCLTILIKNNFFDSKEKDKIWKQFTDKLNEVVTLEKNTTPNQDSDVDLLPGIIISDLEKDKLENEKENEKKSPRQREFLGNGYSPSNIAPPQETDKNLPEFQNVAIM